MIVSVGTRFDDRAESEQSRRSQSSFDIGLYVRRKSKSGQINFAEKSEVNKMQVTLQGYRNLDFKTDSGERVNGTQLFVSFDDETVTGKMTDKLFVRPEIKLPETLKNGDVLNLQFNMKGKVQSIRQESQNDRSGGMPNIENKK